MKQVLNTNGVDRSKAALQYLTGQGIAAWDSSTAYVSGDMSATSGGFLWRCLKANTNKSPLSNPTYWISADPNGERNAILRDAYFIGPPIDYPQSGIGTTEEANFGTFPLVDGDQPIRYSGTGTPITFNPFAITKDKLTYKVGFESSALNLVLRPRDNPKLYGEAVSFVRGDGTSFSEGLQVPQPFADPYSVISTNPGTLGDKLLESMKQSFAQTDWYLAPVTMFRFIIPPPQESSGPLDVVSYGAAVMFRGRVSEFTVDKEEVKLNVASLMEIFKQKVPSQTIQPGNRWAPFDFSYTPDFTGGASPATGGYDWVTITFAPNPAPTEDQLNEGWVLIDIDGVGQWWRRVFMNVMTDSNTAVLYLLDPLPINLDGQHVLCKLWMSSDTGTNTSGPGSGFPRVPQPLTGIS